MGAVTTLCAPSGTTSVSVGGVEYPVTAGCVTVPDAAVPALVPHGFTLAPAPAAQVAALMSDAPARRRAKARDDEPVGTT